MHINICEKYFNIIYNILKFINFVPNDTRKNITVVYVL